VLAVGHRQPFGADRGRDDGLAHGHRLEDLQARAAADPQRHDVDRRVRMNGRTSSTRP
jgi:hypothetical protein